MTALLSTDWQYVDKLLIFISWISTCAFVTLTLLYGRRRPQNSTITINFCLPTVVLTAIGIFAWLSNTNVLQVPTLLFTRLYDGTYKRLCLLLFWTLCVAESLLFSMLINYWMRKADTCHRKFFHLTISLIAISGLCYDPKFLVLSAHLVLQIFIIIEVLRSQRIQPWADWLDDWLLIFVDSQDSSDLILTPIFLLAGIFLPVFFDFNIYSPEWTLKQRHFAGVLSVGIGDSFAAIVGSRYGKIPWPFSPLRKSGSNRRKTMEGSLAMFIAQILSAELLFGLCSLNSALIAAALVSTLVEAHLNCCDNLIIPLCAMLVFTALE